jgi:hypothetical protein
MKIKYIFSMIAGLLILVTTSCSEKKTTDTDAAKATSEEGATPAETPAETSPEAEPEVQPEAEPEEAPDTSATEAPSAYYVMFKGDGG